MYYTFLISLCAFFLSLDIAAGQEYPIGEPDLMVEYRLENDGAIPESVVERVCLRLGPLKEKEGERLQWLRLDGVKTNQERFTIWILSSGYPSTTVEKDEQSIKRYILQEGNRQAVEFRHEYTGEAVLPALGGWEHLWPRPVGNGDSILVSNRMRYLGNSYTLENRTSSDFIPCPSEIHVLELLPDALIGVPHNTKQVDDTRRFDDSDYELVRLTRADYDEMIDAGMNCFRVDREQADWLIYRPVFYWGLQGKDIRYPEELYRSAYLGPTIFLDEPGVHTRDHVIRPRLREELEFRKSITLDFCFDQFKQLFAKAKNEGNPTALLRGLAGRSDVDIGEMEFLQKNVYSWETFVSTALHQLAEQKNGPPDAIVFEPPGRIGSRRTLPEMNMTYQCQIPVDSPKNFIDIIYGFLRGAARVTGKTWGTSIYGSVDRDDAFWFLTHAYDMGAERFFFWDSHRLACVPYSECLALARNLRNHIESHPHRDLERLKQAAEIAILIPPGYNFGHVHMGRGDLWGVGELNLECCNQYGVPYRAVMNHFFIEIERCLRLGIAFDLFWDLDSFDPSGYREIVRILEDGTIAVEKDGRRTILSHPRVPMRPDGAPPQIGVSISKSTDDVPTTITAKARLTEGAAPIYYTPGSNEDGVYINQKVLWELFGPEEEDYHCLSHPFEYEKNQTLKENTADIQFRIDRPGTYRLRAAVCDVAGRTSIAWRIITIQE